MLFVFNSNFYFIKLKFNTGKIMLLVNSSVMLIQFSRTTEEGDPTSFLISKQLARGFSNYYYLFTYYSKMKYLSWKKSPKSSTITAAGNVLWIWNAAKYFLIPSSSSTYLKSKLIRVITQIIFLCYDFHKVKVTLLHLNAIEDITGCINALKLGVRPKIKPN